MACLVVAGDLRDFIYTVLLPIDVFPCTSYKNVSNMRASWLAKKIKRAYSDSAKAVFNSIQAK